MTAAEIAEVLGMALSTVSQVAGADRPRQAQPPGAARAAQPLRAKAPRRADPRRRQEAGADQRRAPGHRVTGHRRARRGSGARDGAPAGSSSTSASMTPPASPTSRCWADEKGATAAGFLRRAVSWFKGMGITVERVLSDNGSCYRSGVHAEACAELYLNECPSRSFTLRNLGRSLVDFIADKSALTSPLQSLCLDITRLEWAHIESIRQRIPAHSRPR